MKKSLLVLTAVVAVSTLAGCVVVPTPYGPRVVAPVSVVVPAPAPVVVAPAPVVGYGWWGWGRGRHHRH